MCHEHSHEFARQEEIPASFVEQEPDLTLFQPLLEARFKNCKIELSFAFQITLYIYFNRVVSISLAKIYII